MICAVCTVIIKSDMGHTGAEVIFLSIQSLDCEGNSSGKLLDWNIFMGIRVKGYLIIQASHIFLIFICKNL